MRILLVLAVVIAATGNANAVEPAKSADALAQSSRAKSDYLEPRREPIPQLRHYQEIVNSVLADAFAADVKARAIVEPSFAREFAVGIKESLGQYRIVGVESRVQLWGFEVLSMLKRNDFQAVSLDGSPRNDAEISTLEAALPKSVEEVRVTRCEARISAALARRVLAVWETMLKDTRAHGRLGLDGVSYAFAFNDGTRVLEGETWSPEDGSRGAMLVGIVHTMKRTCSSALPFLLRAQLEREVTALEERL